MLSGLRQFVTRARFVPRRGLSSSLVAANQDIATSSEAAAFNGIIDRETLEPPTIEPATAVPAPVWRAVSADPSPPIRIPLQYDPLLEYLVGCLNRTGKKRRQPGNRAQGRKIVTDTLLNIHTLTRAPPLPILRKAVEYASPILRNVPYTLPAKKILYPQPLSERQRTHMAIKWILYASQVRHGKSLAHRLAREIIAIVEGAGKERMDEISIAYKLKEDLHKLGMMNRGNVMRPRARGKR